MQIEQIFMELGLQDKEPDVYLALLKTPGAQPASIIANRANLNRTTVYKSLIKLAKKGLVTKTQRQGITCFFAEDPDKSLENLMKKKRTHLDIVNQNLMGILPEIQNIQQQELKKPKMRYYEGYEGIKHIYEDTLVVGETIYAFADFYDDTTSTTDETTDAFTDSHNLLKKLINWLDKEYLPRRIDKKIFAYVLTPKNPNTIKYRAKDKKTLKETRFIPKNNFPIETEINIYGKNVAFYSNKADDLFSVIIENPTIANSLKSIFNLCWQISK